MSGFAPPSAGLGTRFIYSHDFKWKMQPTDQEIENFPSQIIRRTNKNGKDLVEIWTDKIEGRLVDLGEREVSFEPGKENFVTIQDDEGVKFRISMKYQGRQILDFLKRVPGIREDLPIQLGIFKTTQASKEAGKPDLELGQIYVRQQDANGEWKVVPNQFPYDKDNPEKNIMPPFREFTGKGGKKEYDPDPQYQWLLNTPGAEYMGRISKLIVPVSASAPVAQPKPQSPASMNTEKPLISGGGPEEAGYTFDGADDDLPF